MTLFSENATYQWGPFGDLLRGPDEIRDRWRTSVDIPGENRRLLYDGVFAVALVDSLCHEFREWWNSSETPLI